jgi:hypothetical protein
MSDIRLDNSLKNLERVAGLIHDLRMEGCGGLYCPEKETVSVTVRAEGIPPMEVILGWLYPPRFTFQDDGPMYDLVEYLEGLSKYTVIMQPYAEIIEKIKDLWLEQLSWVDIDSEEPGLGEVLGKYKRYLKWYAERSKGSEGHGLGVAISAGGLCVSSQCLSDDSSGAAAAGDRPDLEMTDEERWKRFEELEKRVEALEQFRKVGF